MENNFLIFTYFVSFYFALLICIHVHTISLSGSRQITSTDKCNISLSHSSMVFILYKMSSTNVDVNIYSLTDGFSNQCEHGLGNKCCRDNC